MKDKPGNSSRRKITHSSINIKDKSKARRRSSSALSSSNGGVCPVRAQVEEAVRKSTRRRIEATFYLLIVVMLGYAGRMVYLQVFKSSDAAEADKMFIKERILPAPRGQIVAEDGTALAVTVNEYSVAVNPRAVADKPKMAKLLVQTLGGAQQEYETMLAKTEHANGRKNYYVRLARHVDEARIDKLKALMLPPKGRDESRQERAARKDFWSPITVSPTPRRRYPLGNFASQLVGFTTASGKGVGGLEHSFNKTLAGTNGEVISQEDAQHRPIPGFVETWREAQPGRTLVTTIDPEIQAGAQAVMEELVKKYTPNFATAVVMRPSTGEVLAMVTAPSFDLNKRPKNVVDLATNRCLKFAYEPGSTFKIITASAAVENVPDWQTHTFYCNGVQQVGHHLMHCWINSTSKKRHGTVTLSDSIRDSCNFGVYGFARLMGAPTLLEYAKKFGIGQKTDLGNLAEHPGLLPRNNPRSWSPEQLANFSFGQGMLMTPVQLASVASVIANDGIMMKPMVVKGVRDERGKLLEAYKPTAQRRVIKASTARIVKGMMERVVQEGTARKYIFVPGYKCAGKTGSAQKADGPRGYMAGKFISSFVGMVPAEKPEFVIVVMADEPHGSHWGSEVCGPAFTGIARKAMLRLRVEKGADAPTPDPALMTRDE